jgi:hypothetical protein
MKRSTVHVRKEDTSMTDSQRIYIHALAPAKPQEGEACNGCGVCCLAQPCPLGVVLSGSRSGACKALVWDDTTTRYRCGAIVSPYRVVLNRLPRSSPWLIQPLARVLARALPWLAKRWIAADTACDSSFQTQPPVDGAVGDNAKLPTTTLH